MVRSHEVVREGGSHASDIPSLLVLVLHLAASHLLLELPLEEVDLELELLLNLLALCLFFYSQISFLLELFLIASLQRPNLVLSSPNSFSLGFLLFDGSLGVLLGLLCRIFSDQHLILGLLDLLLEVDAFLLPLREDSLDLLLHCALFVFDLVPNLLELSECFLVGPFEIFLFTVVLPSDLRNAILMLLSRFHELHTQVVYFVVHMISQTN